jgi:hypothetical protein
MRSIHFNSSTVITLLFKCVVLSEYNKVDLLVTGSFCFNSSTDFNAQFTVPQTIKYCVYNLSPITTEALTSVCKNKFSTYTT